MIQIVRKEDCCGCEACRQVCPKQCIQMKADNEGFLYPHVDTGLCIDCHLCEKVCPVINQGESRTPLTTFAATNTDVKVKERSSSGGVFFALAKAVIEQGGVVFGVKFDENWQPIHSWADNLDSVKTFQGSKYVQSRIGDAFAQAQKFLKQGRKVLFSGTPCEIAGLRLFLRKDYGELLLTIAVACHGVPSSVIWSEFLKSQANGKEITFVTFRDKRNGWDKYGMRIDYADNTEFFQPMPHNLFMQGFLRDIYLRPSCYSCPSKAGKAGSDITLADFWGIQRHYPELYAKGYYSLVLANTPRGRQILESLPEVSLTETDYQVALSGNPALVRSVRRPKAATDFWQEFPSDGLAAITRAVKRTSPSMPRRILRKLISIAKRIIK